MKHEGNRILALRRTTIIGLALVLPLAVLALSVSAADAGTSPPASFKKVSSLGMVPLKDIDAHRNFPALGSVAAGVKLDHTAIQYNPGHPGVEEPHYHVVQWLISPAEVKAQMQ